MIIQVYYWLYSRLHYTHSLTLSLTLTHSLTHSLSLSLSRIDKTMQIVLERGSIDA